MLEIINQTNIHIDTTLLERIATYITQRDIELVFVDNPTIQKLNREFLGKDYPTDVLSFPLESFGIDEIPLGSVIISIDKAQELSQKLCHSLESEIALLFIHGCLHLMGYDHECDNGEHRDEEEKIIQIFRLPQSLIVRNQTNTHN